MSQLKRLSFDKDSKKLTVLPVSQHVCAQSLPEKKGRGYRQSGLAAGNGRFNWGDEKSKSASVALVLSCLDSKVLTGDLTFACGFLASKNK